MPSQPSHNAEPRRDPFPPATGPEAGRSGSEDAFTESLVLHAGGSLYA